jgi:neutral ceramidase
MRPIGAWIKVSILFAAAAFIMPSFSRAIEAGAAARDYTPPVDEMRVPLGGYALRFGKGAKGVHDPVFVKALALRDEDNLAVIVTMDILSISPVLRKKALSLLEGSGIRDDNFLITASHSHSAPSGMDTNPFFKMLVFGGYNEELADRTAAVIADAVRESLGNLAHAKLRISRGEVKGLTRNRRSHSYNGVTCRFDQSYDPENPLNITDDTMTVLRVDDSSGKPMAVLVHFATHATILTAQNYLISADWPGVMQGELEELYPGTVVMYMNGAEGDQAPAALDDARDSLEWMQIIGKRAAEAAKPLIESAQPIRAAPIKSAISWREFDKRARAMGITLPKFLARKWFPAMPLMVVRAGDVAFMAAPLEMISKMGQAIEDKAQAYVKYPIVAGLANDFYLYCVTPDEFERGGYEVQNTMYGKIEAEVVTEELIMILENLDQF